MTLLSLKITCEIVCMYSRAFFHIGSIIVSIRLIYSTLNSEGS